MKMNGQYVNYLDASFITRVRMATAEESHKALKVLLKLEALDIAHMLDLI